MRRRRRCRRCSCCACLCICASMQCSGRAGRLALLRPAKPFHLQWPGLVHPLAAPVCGCSRSRLAPSLPDAPNSQFNSSGQSRSYTGAVRTVLYKFV